MGTSSYKLDRQEPVATPWAAQVCSQGPAGQVALEQEGRLQFEQTGWEPLPLPGLVVGTCAFGCRHLGVLEHLQVVEDQHLGVEVLHLPNLWAAGT